MLKLALPNGSLQKSVIALFLKAGISLPEPTRQHWVKVDHPLVSQIVWMRPQDISDAVLSGVVDGGIVGYDCYREWRWGCFLPGAEDLLILSSALPYSKRTNGPVKVVLVASENEAAEWPRAGERVLTEFPSWTANELVPGVVPVRSFGSVEALVPSMYRFGITITETGESLKINRLRVVKDLATSQPHLIRRRTSFAREFISTMFTSEGIWRDLWGAEKEGLDQLEAILAC